MERHVCFKKVGYIDFLFLPTCDDFREQDFKRLTIQRKVVGTGNKHNKREMSKIHEKHKFMNFCLNKSDIKLNVKLKCLILFHFN